MADRKLVRLLFSFGLVSGVSLLSGSIAAGASNNPHHVVVQSKNKTKGTSKTGSSKNRTKKAVEKSYHLSGSFTLVSNYSFKVSSQITVGTPRAAGDTKLPPGYDGVVVSIKGSADVDNTTGGREYSGQALASSEIVLLYKEPSPICPTTGNGRTHVFYYLNSTAYCNGPSLNVQAAGTGGMAAHHTVSLQVSSGTCLTAITFTPVTPSPGYCGSIATKAGQDAIDTRASNYARLLKALANPPDLVLWLVRGGGEATLAGQTTLPKGNFCIPDPTFPTDWWVLASSEPITSCGPTFTVGQAGTFQITPVPGAVLSHPTLSLSGNPTWLSITPTSGVLAGTPPAGAEGISTFSIITGAAAGVTNVTSEIFTITVAPLTLLVPPAVT